ncbi:MAG: cysteine--tRNA ligase, partial [Gemmatimonadota bacterium]
PLEPGHARIYTCGLTVYDRGHIGNFRTFCASDLLRRYLKWKGFRVTQVLNITDVDDRTIRGALQKGVGLRDFTEPYVRAFFEDFDTLGLERVEHFPRATEHVPEMVALVERLVERGFAYTADGSVYFQISKFPEYGRLAQLDRAQLRSGRESTDTAYAKEDARDFVLWKGGLRPEEGQIAAWESPWGKGRPGWHLECSVLAATYLGQPFDIHMGGVDLIFPHHTNEIAQAEAASGQTFARVWIHAEHLLIEDRRMGKSEGNVLTIPDLLARGYRPSAVRLLLLSGHYRKQLNFTETTLRDATQRLHRLLDFRRRLRDSPTAPDAPASELPTLIARVRAGFEAGLDDDLNVSEAWAALFNFVRDVHALLDRAATLQPRERDAALDLLRDLDRVFGVLSLADREAENLDPELRRWVDARVAERETARKARDFQRADAIRFELAEHGVAVEDTPQGARWRWESGPTPGP